MFKHFIFDIIYELGLVATKKEELNVLPILDDKFSVFVLLINANIYLEVGACNACDISECTFGGMSSGWLVDACCKYPS